MFGWFSDEWLIDLVINLYILQSSGRGKRVKINNEEEDEKPKEVVHVRARRGQATDSHSLAERVY